ncbi:Multi-copper oxidase [Mycena venus]|uniref:Multi-copper oxidase n=1 Tax=Mycena venus TaxID=2733690 RepID=A0A8H7D2M5_9AGAR|nr:Multi-copper oxidase [Mycena venus]
MQDADADEQELLITSPDADRWARGPSRRRRVSAISTLVLLVLPFAFLLWMTSWSRTSEPNHLESDSTSLSVSASVAFHLNPSFDITAPPRTLVHYWNVSEVPIPGENRTRIVVAGRSPGPLIEANAHDRILVYVTNGLEKEGTSIHWHGLPQPQTPFYDGASGISQCPIPPGATLLYNFTFGGWTGTTWWHGHTGMQHTDGLFGPIVVHSPDERHEYAADHVLTLSDTYTIPANELLETYLSAKTMETAPEPVPDGAAINGRGGGPHDDKPLTDGRKTVQRDGRSDGYFEVKVLAEPASASSTPAPSRPLRISIDGHALTLVEADGSRLAPRYSVLVERDPDNKSEEFWIRARMVEDKFAYDNPNMRPEARAILRYTLSPTTPSLDTEPLPTTRPGPPPGSAQDDVEEWFALPQFDEWALRPQPSPPSSSSSNDTNANTTLQNTEPPIPIPNTDILTLPFTFSIQRTHDLTWRSFINRTAWEVPTKGEAALVGDTARLFADGEGKEGEGVRVWPGDQLIASLRHGRVVDFVITNLDDGDHPFHLHGYSPWLLGSGRGRFKPTTANLDTSNPLRRDTFTVPARGWAVVRIVADNAGYWACTFIESLFCIVGANDLISYPLRYHLSNSRPALPSSSPLPHRMAHARRWSIPDCGSFGGWGRGNASGGYRAAMRDKIKVIVRELTRDGDVGNGPDLLPTGT